MHAAFNEEKKSRETETKKLHKRVKYIWFNNKILEYLFHIFLKHNQTLRTITTRTEEGGATVADKTDN